MKELIEEEGLNKQGESTYMDRGMEALWPGPSLWEPFSEGTRDQKV